MLKVVAKNKWEKKQLEWAFDGWEDAVASLEEDGEIEERKEFGNVQWDGKNLTADFNGFDEIQYRLDNQLRDMIYQEDIEVEKRDLPKLNALVKRMDEILYQETK